MYTRPPNLEVNLVDTFFLFLLMEKLGIYISNHKFYYETDFVQGSNCKWIKNTTSSEFLFFNTARVRDENKSCYRDLIMPRKSFLKEIYDLK